MSGVRDVFSAVKKASDGKPPTASSSFAVSMSAIAAHPEYPYYSERPCLLAERTNAPGELVLRCAPQLDTTSTALPIALRVDGAHPTGADALAVWIGDLPASLTCSPRPTEANAAHMRTTVDVDVTCRKAQADNYADQAFLLSRVDEADRPYLPWQSDTSHLYRLSTHDHRSLCRVIDHDGGVTCVSTANDKANHTLGVFFKVIPT